MDFLLQLDLKRPMELSHRFTFAYIFMCHAGRDHSGGAGCKTHLPGGGANSLVLVEHVGHELAEPGPGVRVWPKFTLEFAPREDPAVREQREQQAMEQLAERLRQALEGGQREFVIHDDLGQDERPQTVCIGGEPEWLLEDQTPLCPACGGPMRLLAQIDAEVVKWSETDPGLYLPFGGAGQAYAFICRQECSPGGAALLWQCG